MADSVTLNKSQRTTLQALQRTQEANNRTNQRLATAKRVNAVTDDAVAFFQARQLTNRASDLNGRIDSIGQGTSAVQAALTGGDAINSLNQQLKAIKDQAAQTTDPNQLQQLASQFNTISNQIDLVAADTSYQGKTLIDANSTKLTVQTDTNSTVQVQADDLTAASLGIPSTVTAAQLGSQAFLDNLAISLDNATGTIRQAQAEQGVSVATLQVREDFAKGQSNIAQEGADKLTDADLNEEAARRVAGQTQQLLGVNSLSLSAQFEKSILQLFRSR
jgi:flagellin-like hook-associated protein FlgL